MNEFVNSTPEQLAVDPGYTGSRADALNNGEIVDMTERGRQGGFKWPVALTKKVEEQCNGTRDALVDHCVALIKEACPESDRYIFKFEQNMYQIVATPGDEGEPVLTIRIPA